MAPKKGKKGAKSSSKTASSSSADAAVATDARFSHVGRDARFQRTHTQKDKLQVDERFTKMFNDPAFKINSESCCND
jgi:hypothetical protein